MTSKTFIGSDYITRRGSEETTTGFKNNNSDQNRPERGNIILGETGLKKSSISPFIYNYAKQYFIGKGIEEPVARSMILLANDIAKLHNKPIQVVLEELENEGSSIYNNPVVKAFAKAKITGDMTAVQIITGGTYYAVNDIIDVTGGSGSNATLKVTSIADEMTAMSTLSIDNPGSSYVINSLLTLTGGATIMVDSVGVGGEILTFTIVSVGGGNSVGDALAATSGIILCDDEDVECSSEVLVSGGENASFIVSSIVNVGVITSAVVVDGGTGYLTGDMIGVTGGTQSINKVDATFIVTSTQGSISEINVINHGIGCYQDFTIGDCAAVSSTTITTSNSFDGVKVGNHVKNGNDFILITEVASDTQIVVETEITLLSPTLTIRPTPTLTITGDGVGAVATASINDDGLMTVTVGYGGVNYTTSKTKVEISPVSIIKQNSFNLKSHGYYTGERIYFTAKTKTETESSLPPEIDEVDEIGKLVVYYAIAVDRNTLKLATTEKNANLGISINLSQPALSGGFTIYKYFKVSMTVDSYLYMNAMRPTSNQMMAMEKVKVSESVRNYRIVP